MARKGRLPKLIDWWAGRIKQENPKLTIGQAIAIAIAQGQKYGYIRKGTIVLTKKGQRWAKARAYGKRLPLDLRRVYREEKRKRRSAKRKSTKRKRRRK